MTHALYFFWVFLGGGLGSMARYGVSLLIQRQSAFEFPLATLISNMASTMILGYIVWKWNTQLSHSMVIFLTIGFCGGFSTFSTFSLETFQLIRSEQWFWAISNVIVSAGAAIALLFILSKSLR